MPSDTPPQNSNGGPKLWGVPVSVIQSIGPPTIFMLFIMWLVASYVPPWLSAQVNLMDRTGSALEGIDKSMEENTQIMHELKESNAEAALFRKQTNEVHSKQVELLEKQTSVLDKACAGHADTEQKIDDIHHAVVKP